ncbi:MAG: DUF1887 family CARF protein [Ardenticatenaceae bacterium]|nr:DUF1887 family CARF protein [Ardenticatenaceae bacterium]
MSQQVTVLILGGRLTPNLVGILALQPHAVEFIVSEDTRARYDEILAVLEQFADLDYSPKPHYLSAYDFVATRDACLAVAQAHAGAEVVFDITSAPKTMGFAAYEVARFLQQRAVIVDTANGRLLDLVPPNAAAMPIEISLEQYLACYGRRPVPTFAFVKLSVSRKQAIEAARYLVTAGMAATEAMDKVRSWNQGKGKRTIPFQRTQPLSTEMRDVLHNLQAFGLITNLQKQADGRVQYTILNDMDWEYLKGTWLEVFVWDQAQHCLDDNQRPLFGESDLALSFAIPSDGARKQIDVGYVYHGQFIHASCKTGARPFKTEFLDELRAVSSLVGDRFTSRLFITNAFPPSETDPDYARFLAQAKDRAIVVVTGKELPDVGGILKQQALRPSYSRI